MRKQTHTYINMSQSEQYNISENSLCYEVHTQLFAFIKSSDNDWSQIK